MIIEHRDKIVQLSYAASLRAHAAKVATLPPKPCHRKLFVWILYSQKADYGRCRHHIFHPPTMYIGSPFRWTLPTSSCLFHSSLFRSSIPDGSWDQCLSNYRKEMYIALINRGSQHPWWLTSRHHQSSKGRVSERGELNNRKEQARTSNSIKYG